MNRKSLVYNRFETSLRAALAAALLLPFAASAQDEDVFILEDYVVEGREFDAMAAAILAQRDADSIRTVVDAGAFGDVTEGNVGEFLKFLPGVSVDFVSADIRSVSVRGLPSANTPVTVDGNRMASAASSSSSRTFEFEQVSLNNVARIEVTKVPTPAMEADSLGGQVNMISRNAFEAEKARLNYRVSVNAPHDHLKLGRSPGPGDFPTRKVRPAYDFNFLHPVNDNFGYVINYLSSEAFTPQSYVIKQWDARGGSTAEDPYLRFFNVRDGPKLSFRESGSVKFDFRITPKTIVSLSGQVNDYSTTFFNREIRWETNLAEPPGTYSPDFTIGDGSGRFRHQLNTREKTGRTYHADIGVKHFLNEWEIDYDAYYSRSTNEYKDLENGYFERAQFRTGDRTPFGLGVEFRDIGPDGPGQVVTTGPEGEPFDPFTLGNNNDLEIVRSRPEFARDEIYGGKFNIRRNLSGFAAPTYVQAGGLYRRQERNIQREEYNWRPTTAAYRANPPDIRSTFGDTHYVNQSPGFGWPAVEWPSTYRTYEYFQANPTLFNFQEANAIRYAAENRIIVEETVKAAYLMGSTGFIDNRLRVLGGVRFERTETFGEGYLYDANVIYVRDAQGRFVSDNPLIPDEDVQEPSRMNFRQRHPEFVGLSTNHASIITAQYGGRQQQRGSYDDFYPSLHFTYEATPNLQVRLAYARTLGRPDINDLAPATRFENDGEADEGGVSRPTIYIANPDLVAYTGDNFDLSVEYYLDTGGVLSAGVFYKEIKGFIDVEMPLLTNELADLYGIDRVYVAEGWLLQRTANVGDVTIKGFELSMVQDLTFAPESIGNFSVFANATILTTSGDYGATGAGLVSSYIPGFVKETYNWGVTYDKGPLDIRLKWNYRGKQMRDTGDVRGALDDGTLWNRFYDSRLTTDLNIEYRFNRHLRLFLNGRNIFDEPVDQLRVTAVTPDHAQLERREKFGPLWSLGVKGQF
ncbi:MAG: TonB-dependent receptor [Opitutales bacterium]|nr:TonB-dependent receptor [Opitutales bacterium]